MLEGELKAYWFGIRLGVGVHREFPVIAWEFPVTPKYFPVSLRRELPQKGLQRSGFWLGNQVSEPLNRKIPCKIPC
jgi:hypothetical protein